MVYLVFPTTHCQGEKLMEETFLLSSSDSHVTSKHGVQSCTVSDEGWTNRQRLQRTAATFNVN